jgi:hypothetical protein
MLKSKITLNLTGLPTALDESELIDEARSALELMEAEDVAEVLHNVDPRIQAAVDPGSVYHGAAGSSNGATSGQVKIAAADLAVLKIRFPRLKEFSDGFLQARTMDELLKIESTSIKLKDAERRCDVEERLSSNKQNLECSAVTLAAGSDNRWSILHRGRFLAGAACSTKKLWLTARESMDVAGHSPVANYDMASVGLGGFVTSKGWLEIANPGSTKMAIKLFNINNVGSKSGASKAASSEEMAEIAELGELKLAVRSMRVAGHFACPWNFSFVAIENFMLQNDWCMSDLAGTENPAGTLAQFVDYILHENANRWRDAEPFISTAEMKSCWTAFSSARPRVLIKKDQPRAQAASSNARPAQKMKPVQVSNFFKLPFHHPRLSMPFTDACKAWNIGKCKKAAGNCTTAKGTQLRHVCNWSDISNPNSTPCGQAHQAYLNH